MLALCYTKPGVFELTEKPLPEILDPKDAIVRVTLSSICTSDLHIKHGSVPRARLGVTVGHEMVGVVERTGNEVTSVRPGDRVTVNVETFCGKCFFTDSSTTAQIPTAVGRSAAGLTADRRNLSACPSPTKV